jgi:hypothetical protein
MTILRPRLGSGLIYQSKKMTVANNFDVGFGQISSIRGQ